MNVRFEGNNGHDVDVTPCLLMTQSGHLTQKPPKIRRNVPGAGAGAPAGVRNRRSVSQRACPVRASSSIICKSAAAAAAGAGDLSCIERGPVREFPSAKSSESQFLSSRKRSNIVPRATATDLPSPLALRRRCRSIRDRCRASSAGPSPRPRSARHLTGTSWYATAVMGCGTGGGPRPRETRRGWHL
jgi:hypothetical protein